MPLLAFSFNFADGIPVWVGILLAALGVIILGIAKSGFGGGVGIVAIPMFAIAFGAQLGTAILLPLLLAADTFSVLHHWGKWDKRILKMLAPGTLFGIFVGSILLWLLVVGPTLPWHYDWSQWGRVASPTVEGAARQKASADAMNLIVGVVSILYVLLEQVSATVGAKWVFKPGHRSGFATGSAVGVISTLAHAAGPIGAIFLLNQGLGRAAFMGTTVIYFFGTNVVKLIPYAVIPGLMNWDSIKVGACFVILAPIGTWIGAKLCHRMSEKIFRSTIMVIVFVTGVQLVLEWATGVKLAVVVASWVK